VVRVRSSSPTLAVAAAVLLFTAPDTAADTVGRLSFPRVDLGTVPDLQRRLRAAQPTSEEHIVLVPVATIGVASPELRGTYGMRSFTIVRSDGTVDSTVVGPFPEHSVSLQSLSDGRKSVLTVSQEYADPRFAQVHLESSPVGERIAVELEVERWAVTVGGTRVDDQEFPEGLVTYWNVSADGAFGFLGTREGATVVRIDRGKVVDVVWKRSADVDESPALRGVYSWSLFSPSGDALAVTELIVRRENRKTAFVSVRGLRSAPREAVVTMDGHGELLAVSRSGRLIAIRPDYQSRVEVYDVETGSAVATVIGQPQTVTELLEWGHSDRFVVFRDGKVSLYEIDDGSDALSVVQTMRWPFDRITPNDQIAHHCRMGLAVEKSHGLQEPTVVLQDGTLISRPAGWKAAGVEGATILKSWGPSGGLLIGGRFRATERPSVVGMALVSQDE